jgi:AraC-like DNA-binding protein
MGRFNGAPMARKAVIGSIFFLLVHLADAQVTFIIESLPTATPGTDTIFITGTFNNWVPNDPQYAVKWQLNGQLAVTIPEPEGKIEYKFTRGSWTKVETNKENKYTDNRVFPSGPSKRIYIRIDNWLDLGGARKLNYVIFYFFACAFQTIALSLIVYRLHKKDDLKFKPLLTVNAVLIVLLVALIVRETVNQVSQSYFVFLFHVSLFCWGPLLLFFIASFHTGRSFPKIHFYFLPALVVLIFVIIRVLNISSLSFLSIPIKPPLAAANLAVIVTGFLFNIITGVFIYRRFAFLKPGRETNRSSKARLLYYFFWTSSVALLLIPVGVILILSGVHIPFITDFYSIAIVLSALIFIETYFLWRYPEIVKEDRINTAPSEDSQNWIEKLNAFMTREKPYKNADLSVSDLAEMLGTKPHVLSRIINDSYHKNFRDFVNTYRIEEFIRLVNTKEFKHYTFLALAQEVGFNSKSTFNLAFKKMTNQSPREYFKSKELL